MPPRSILIVGAGVAGPTLASFLLLSPIPASELPCITLLERSPSLRYAGQNIDVRGAGVTIIRKLGLENVVRAHLTHEEGIRFVDANDGTIADFPADKTGKLQTATSDVEILRGRLGEILYKRLEHISEGVKQEGGTGVEFIFGDYIDHLEQAEDKVKVKFAKSSHERSFDIVVGADGLQSRTRKMAFGEGEDESRLKKLGLYAAFFSMPRTDTDNSWCRWYRQPGRKTILIRPGETNDRSTALMMMMNETDPRLSEVIAKRDVEGQRSLFAEYYRNGGWESDRLIREMDRAEDFYCDMIAQVRMQAWSQGRVVLLGDAGYCGTPISGMGTTFGLMGAYNLAGALSRHPQNHAAAFAEYDTTMRPFVERGQTLPPGIPRLSFPETAWGLWLLNTVLWFIASSGLGNWFQGSVGPPADEARVEDYGFRDLPEWTSWHAVLGS